MNRELRAELSEISKFWNTAELTIKTAEQLNDIVVNPAISELRYAGRRVVDAICCYENDEHEAKAMLRDARFFCQRAQHDAIDASISSMVQETNAIRQKISATILNRSMPEFMSHFAQLIKAEELISKSREDRTKRQAVYDSFIEDQVALVLSEDQKKAIDHIKSTLEHVDLQNLQKEHRRLLSKVEFLEAEADEEEKNQKRLEKWARKSNIIGIIGITIAIVGIAINFI